MSSTNYPIQTLQHLTLRPRYPPQHPTPNKHQKKTKDTKLSFATNSQNQVKKVVKRRNSDTISRKIAVF